MPPIYVNVTKCLPDTKQKKKPNKTELNNVVTLKGSPCYTSDARRFESDHAAVRHASLMRQHKICVRSASILTVISFIRKRQTMYLAQQKSQAGHELERSTAICGLTLGRRSKIKQIDQSHTATESLSRFLQQKEFEKIATPPGRVEVSGMFFFAICMSLVTISTYVRKRI